MLKNKLVTVFYALKPWQQVALLKFVTSPYFNKREDVIKLCQYLQSINWNKDRYLLKKEFAYAHVFGDKTAFDAKKMRHTMSFLLKTIERFLTIQELESDKIEQQTALAKAYKKLQLPQFQSSYLKKAQILVDKAAHRNIKWWTYRHNIEVEQYDYLVNHQPREKDINLQRLSNVLDAQFIAEKLKYVCCMMAHESTLNVEYDRGLLHLILKYIEERPELLEHPSISLNYYYYQSKHQIQDELLYFKKFKTELLKSHDLFELDELRILYALAASFGIKKVNRNQLDFYLEETFKIYKSSLELGAISRGGYLSHFAFLHITTLAIMLHEYNWLDHFIHDYQGQLAPQYRLAYFNISRAMVAFERKDYDQVILLLQQSSIEHHELHTALLTKGILVKAYYEKKEFQALDSYLFSFSAYLKRKKKTLPVDHYKAHKSFIKFAQKLQSLKPFDKKAKIDLKDAINTCPMLPFRNWLLTQLNVS